MRTTILLFFLSLNLVRGSVGTPMELVFPADSASLSASSYAVAMNDRHIVAGSHTALNGAGEAHVFSATTGRHLRRLRAPLTSQLGGKVAVSGNRAFLSSGQSSLLAFDVTNGRLLWRVNITDLNQSAILPMNAMSIDSLAADGDTVLVGMMSAFLTDLGEQGLHTSQGAILSLSAVTGQSKGVRMAGDGQAFAHLGASVAVAGPLFLAGEIHRTVNGQAKAGRTLLFNETANSLPLAFQAPAPAAEDMFGSAVAVAGARFLIGAPMMDHSGKTDIGRVYVYDRHTASLAQTLTPPSSLPNSARFGSSIAGCGSLAVIGGQGNAWLYDCPAHQLAALTPATAVSAMYGRSVAICSHSLVVTDPGSSGGSLTMGRVHWFRKVGRAIADSQIIASTGKQAPGANGGTLFSSFADTCLSDTGKAGHLAAVKGGGATSVNNAGFWNNLGGTLDLVLRKGDAVSGKRFGAPFKPFFSTAGTASYFLARQSGTGRQFIFADSGSAFAPMVGEGDSVAVGVSVLTLGKLNEVVPCSHGNSQLAASFSAKTGVNGVAKNNDSFVGRRGIFTFLEDAREGRSSPVNGFNYGQIGPQVSAFDDHLAFITTLTGAQGSSGSAVVVKNLGNLDFSAYGQRGNPAGGAGGASFRTPTSVQMHKGQVLYKATLSGGASGVTSGLWRNQLAVAVKTWDAPGMAPGVKFRRILEYFNAGNLVTIFRAQVSGPGITSANDTGIWVNRPEGNQLLLREGAPIPNSGGLRVGVIQRLDAHVTGHYGILVSLAGADSSRNQALLAGCVANAALPFSMPVIVMHKGTSFDKAVPAGISSISMAPNHIDRHGAGSKAARQVNAHGLLVSAMLSGARDLLLVKR